MNSSKRAGKNEEGNNQRSHTFPLRKTRMLEILWLEKKGHNRDRIKVHKSYLAWKRQMQNDIDWKEV